MPGFLPAWPPFRVPTAARAVAHVRENVAAFNASPLAPRNNNSASRRTGLRWSV
jgi:hypothetical protein